MVATDNNSGPVSATAEKLRYSHALSRALAACKAPLSEEPCLLAFPVASSVSVLSVVDPYFPPEPPDFPDAA